MSGAEVREVQVLGVEVLGVEVLWCPGCHADRTVEMVRLAADPEPVAVCTDCGVGLDAWLTADLVEPRSAGRRQGAA
jgi:hypothetical protein